MSITKMRGIEKTAKITRIEMSEASPKDRQLRDVQCRLPILPTRICELALISQGKFNKIEKKKQVTELGAGAL